MTLSTAEAKLELAILNANAQQQDQAEFFARFTNAGLPPEVVLRLQELWEVTKVVGGKTIHVGKIIGMKVLEFVAAHPHLAIGVALGAAIGALTYLIPWLGPLLAPITITLGAVVGGAIGSGLDRGQTPMGGPVGVAQEIIVMARQFFELLATIFNALRAELDQGRQGA